MIVRDDKGVWDGQSKLKVRKMIVRCGLIEEGGMTDRIESRDKREKILLFNISVYALKKT